MRDALRIRAAVVVKRRFSDREGWGRGQKMSSVIMVALARLLAVLLALYGVWALTETLLPWLEAGP